MNNKDQSKVKVLFAVWELEPFLKVGGLGEVARSLPRALKLQGVDIRLIIPYYKALKTFRQRKKLITTLRVKYGNKQIKVTVHEIKFLSVSIPVYLVGSSPILDVPNKETFILFSAAVVQAVEDNHLSSWIPNIIHCNDNHTGLIPLLITIKKLNIKTLMTIHNISPQQCSSLKSVEKINIPKEYLSFRNWEIEKKQVNFLLEGIIHADRVNTVSPTYLKEIQTEQGGAGLDDFIKKYLKKTSAILNGIDYIFKNPITDPSLSVRYSSSISDYQRDTTITDFLTGKRLNKIALQEKLGLPIDESIPLVGFIGRFDAKQKGIDLIHRMLVRNQIQNCQFIVMGQGEEAWEKRFSNLGIFYPERIKIITPYNDSFASQIYAASDFIMIPSYFEPCCLVQMNAMRYGALPVARITGGLNDTIIDGKNGFFFKDSTSVTLENSLKRAIRMKYSFTSRYNKMVEQAMKKDFSWLESAKKYINLYNEMLFSTN